MKTGLAEWSRVKGGVVRELRILTRKWLKWWIVWYQTKRRL